MTKRYIGLDEFNEKLRAECNNAEVKVKLGDLGQVMKAAKKCLKFVIMSDSFIGGGLAVEDKEMAQAYKNINEYLNKIKDEIENERAIKLNKLFTTKVD